MFGWAILVWSGQTFRIFGHGLRYERHRSARLRYAVRDLEEALRQRRN